MHRARSFLSVLAALTLAMGGLAACGGDDDDAADDETTTTESEDQGGENTLQVEMQDYSYETSGALAEGWTRLEFENTGEEYHMAGLGRLKEGVTLADVTDALSQAGGEEGGEESSGEEESSEESLGEVELISSQETTSTTAGDNTASSIEEAPATSEGTTDTSTDDQPTSSDDTTDSTHGDDTTDSTVGDDDAAEEESEG